MSENNDQRQFSRIPFEAGVAIDTDAGRYEVELLDLSLKGALVALPQGWQPSIDETCRLELQLDSESDTTITMEARVVHREAGHIGLACDHIDVDSITHLRRLIELNLGNPELLDRELAALSAA